ncbi:histidine kinase [Agrococcus sp. SL85]|uniref:sensor histidine kinase n=1 Tax=Agrococcus sp. SL85 TaxID=2995141 RepID=UPI00226D022D|nr:histidine kinase [Agrococcus sp. SL85]WAC67393.1 histidine kinase [Agrococcus sp. SL85]
MTSTSSARILRVWWPAALAVAVTLVLLTVLPIYTWLVLIALATVGTALAISVRFPLHAAGVAALGALVSAASEGDPTWLLLLVAYAALLIATWRFEPALARALSIVPVAILVAIVLVVYSTTQERSPFGSAFQNTQGLVVWILVMVGWGAVLGLRALLDAARAEQHVEVAVARTSVVESELRDERLRADLTHDFHDVMAHSLAVLAAQAEGLRLSYEQHPERIGPVLTTISDTARLALVELRQLLERVDDDERRPQPTSADIPGLVAQLRSAGPAVSLQDSGRHGHLSRIADIAAYRIVQESLTNALRHGGPDVDVAVWLTWTGPGLAIAVSSPIRDRETLRPAGRGIAGMHERARLAGGALEVDAEGDRFVVSAHLPYSPVHEGPTPPLGEDQLATLPVPLQRAAPEAVVAPWIVEATRRAEGRRRARQAAPEDWSTATTIDLGPGLPNGRRVSAPAPDGRVPNPTAPDGRP